MHNKLRGSKYDRKSRVLWEHSEMKSGARKSEFEDLIGKACLVLPFGNNGHRVLSDAVEK